MDVLITNSKLHQPGGTEVVAMQLARGLRHRNHRVALYSNRLGHVAEMLRAEDIPVVHNPSATAFQPDLIHGQHNMETMAALMAFPNTPAIFYSHGAFPWEERPLLFPRILRYLVTNRNAVALLSARHGIPDNQIVVRPNAVDLSIFPPRSSWPEKLRRAAVYSSAPPGPEIKEELTSTCHQQGIVLDLLGPWTGNAVEHPERVLPEYDLVFCSGRSALESLVCGCAVIVLLGNKLGPMIVPDSLQWWRERNFAVQLDEPGLPPGQFREELKKYSPGQQRQIMERLREEAGLEEYSDQMDSLYQEVIMEWREMPRPSRETESVAVAEYLGGLGEVLYGMVDAGRSREGRSDQIRKQLERARAWGEELYEVARKHTRSSLAHRMLSRSLRHELERLRRAKSSPFGTKRSRK